MFFLAERCHYPDRKSISWKWNGDVKTSLLPQYHRYIFLASMDICWKHYITFKKHMSIRHVHVYPKNNFLLLHPVSVYSSVWKTGVETDRSSVPDASENHTRLVNAIGCVPRKHFFNFLTKVETVPGKPFNPSTISSLSKLIGNKLYVYSSILDSWPRASSFRE